MKTITLSKDHLLKSVVTFDQSKRLSKLVKKTQRISIPEIRLAFEDLINRQLGLFDVHNCLN